MPIQQALIDEIELLLRYNLDSSQEGIKVHHTAREGLISATKRLHEKGLVSREDGGYLTDLGIETAGHTQAALRILTSKN
ncbi:MAG: TIGR02647 family protein [Gammaproteobacteria bacterium]|nr:MAG: TIGR02647 family protein [Gammaproteobacteria bacterium]